MSESLRNDGRVWVPKSKGDQRPADQIPEDERDYYLERRYPSYGNLAPRDISSRAAKERCDAGFGVGAAGMSVYLDFAESIRRQGEGTIRAKYGNLFDMYAQITGEDPYRMPMRIYPAVHYTMGGLWVDYHLQSNLPGLYVLGEANFSDHGANRLGASALMQGLADGYFIIPYTIADHFAKTKLPRVTTDHPAVKESLVESRNRVERLLKVNGRRSVDQFHRALGRILWDQVGMSRTDAGLRQAIEKIRELRTEFWQDVRVLGSGESFNQNLEHAGRRLHGICRGAGARRPDAG
jgi:succinate dehydrogenase / fumarate reductase flavoprotein subunit